MNELPITPREAFDRYLAATVYMNAPRKPGALLAKMPKRVREALAGLKSSDIQNDRIK